MKKVFSIKKFIESMNELGEEIDIETVDDWAKQCDGLTEEEMRQKGFKTHNDWMVLVDA